MKITKIEKQKKRKDRFNIYTDDEFVCGLSENTIIDEALAIGQEIDQKEIEKLVEKDQSAKAFDKAIRFLGYRARTKKEVYDKLLAKEFDEKVIKKTIGKLKEMGYLSDIEFTKSWVKDRIATKPEGKKLLQIELRQKGIEEKMAKEQLEKLVDEKTEVAMAQKALNKALKQYNKLPSREKRQKITSYLARRGFDWQLINMLLNKN
jgi:regulatory protein